MLSELRGQRSALKNALQGVTNPEAEADLQRRLEETEAKIAEAEAEAFVAERLIFISC